MVQTSWQWQTHGVHSGIQCVNHGEDIAHVLVIGRVDFSLLNDVTRGIPFMMDNHTTYRSTCDIVDHITSYIPIINSHYISQYIRPYVINFPILTHHLAFSDIHEISQLLVHFPIPCRQPWLRTAAAP
jgi:hypothetical protein